MDPKSSDDDTVDEAYTELETAKIRKIFLDFGLMILGKKIPEISPTADASASEEKDEKEEEEEDKKEEEEDEDEEEGEEEEGDKDSCESDQEWDVDSFEDAEFHSEDEEDEDWYRYLRQCYISEGFDVGLDYLPTKPGRIYSGFYPLKLDAYFSPPNLTGREYMENMAKYDLWTDENERNEKKHKYDAHNQITFFYPVIERYKCHLIM